MGTRVRKHTHTHTHTHTYGRTQTYTKQYHHYLHYHQQQQQHSHNTHRHTTHTQYTLQLPDTTPKCPGLRSRPAAGPHWRLRCTESATENQPTSEITGHRQRGQGYSAQGRGRHLKGMAPALPSGCALGLMQR